MTDRALELDRPGAPLPEDLVARRDEARGRPGFEPDIYAGHTHVPQRPRNFMATRDAPMHATSLSTPEREMIAVVVSAHNGCHYCMVSHSATPRRITGDAVRVDMLGIDYRAAGITARQRAMLDFAVAPTRQGAAIGAPDRAVPRSAGFTDADIRDIAEVTAFFGMTDRLAGGVGMHPNPEYHAPGR